MDVGFPPLDEILAMGPRGSKIPRTPPSWLGAEKVFRIPQVGQVVPKKGVVGAWPPKWREPHVIS